MVKILKVQNKGDAGRSAEKHLSKRLGGSLHAGSGAIAGHKGDVTVNNTAVGSMLVESKTTTTASLSVKKEWLYKVYQEAVEQGKEPALAIAFVRGDGRSERRDRWVMIPEYLFQELTDCN